MGFGEGGWGEFRRLDDQVWDDQGYDARDGLL